MLSLREPIINLSGNKLQNQKNAVYKNLSNILQSFEKFKGTKTTNNTTVPEDADELFVKSFVAEMETLPHRQKMVFKSKVWEILSSITIKDA